MMLRCGERRIATKVPGGDLITTRRMLQETCGLRYWEDYVFRVELCEAEFVLRCVRNPEPRTSRHGSANADNWNLTRRESEVLDLIRTGAPDKDIARALGVSRSTASKH